METIKRPSSNIRLCFVMRYCIPLWLYREEGYDNDNDDFVRPSMNRAQVILKRYG